MPHLRMGGMHRRIMGGPEAIRLGQQFPGWVQYPGKPLGSRGLPSSSSGSGPGLNQPRRKPAGHAADRNQCTLHAASASCGARSSAGSPTSRPREYQVSRPRNRPERLTLLTRCVMVRRDQELPGPGSRAALRPVAGSPVRSGGAEVGPAKAPDAGCRGEAGRSSRAAGKPPGTAAR